MSETSSLLNHTIPTPLGDVQLTFEHSRIKVRGLGTIPEEHKPLGKCIDAGKWGCHCKGENFGCDVYLINSGWKACNFWTDHGLITHRCPWREMLANTLGAAVTQWLDTHYAEVEIARRTLSDQALEELKCKLAGTVRDWYGKYQRYHCTHGVPQHVLETQIDQFLMVLDPYGSKDPGDDD